MLQALAAQEIAVLVGDVGPRADATGDLERERGEVRALDVVVEVGGREDQATVHALHDGRRPAYAVFGRTTSWTSQSRI